MWILTTRYPRSLAACDGAILVVDASQGIEAQTLANVYLALDHDLDVFPVINKIDLPSAEPERVAGKSRMSLAWMPSAAHISAKTGVNMEEVLEEPWSTRYLLPGGRSQAPAKALIFDSTYDSYKGVIIFCRIMEGTVKEGRPSIMMATGSERMWCEVGIFRRRPVHSARSCRAGMVGYITASIKNVRDTRGGRYGDFQGQPLRISPSRL